MNVKKLLALLLAIMLTASLAACGQKDRGGESSSSAPEEEPDPNWPVAIGDIRIPEKPRAAVSLSPALTEVIFELGAEDQLAGISDFCDYPGGTDGLPRCGTAALPDFEALSEIRPDVVFSSSALSEADTVKLQQMGAEVVVLSRAHSIDELRATYLNTAVVLGGLEDGDQNGYDTFRALEKRWDALTGAAAQVTERLGGVYLRQTPLMMATGDTFEGELLAAIGIENDAAAYTGWEYPADQAANLYPDIIFYDEGIDPDYFKGTQVYNTTDAYKQGRMYPVDGAALERQSGRMFSELEKMFSEAYPELASLLDAPPEGEPEAESSSPEEDGGEDGMLDISDMTQVG